MRLIVRHWHGRVLLRDFFRWLVYRASGFLKLIGVDELFDRVYGVVIILKAIGFGVLSPRLELNSQLLLQNLRLLEPLLERELLLQALLSLLMRFNLLFDCLLFGDFSRVCESPASLEHILLRQHQQGRGCQRFERHLPEVIAWNASRSAW